MEKIYVAKYDSDLTEGRGPWCIAGYFTTPEAAEKAVSHYTYMGGQEAWAVEPATLFDSFAEYSKDSQERARKSILARLTIEERRAIGF